MKKINLLVLLILFVWPTMAQSNKNHDFRAGLLFQKTQYLYLENGVGFDYSAESVFQKRMHFKAAYLSSRFGSAIQTNAIKQDNFLLGVDWRFLSDKNLQIPVGVNTGFFRADYEDPIFDALPNTTFLMSVEAGLVYNFDFPVSAGLTLGYNLKSGNGVNVPGSLFPVYYRLSVYYRL